MGLCCGFRWEGEDCRKGRVSCFRGPSHLLLPPSPEEIFRASVVLKGGGTGRDTEHSGSAEDRAEPVLIFLGCSSLVRLLLKPQSKLLSVQLTFTSHSRGVPEWVGLGGTTGPVARISWPSAQARVDAVRKVLWSQLG